MADQQQQQHRAMNVSHSPLVQQQQSTAHPDANTAPTAAQLDAAKQRELLDARRKFSSSLESNVLDYLHYGPQALEDCVKTMHTLFSNILEHPDDPKYRKVRAVVQAHRHMHTKSETPPVYLVHRLLSTLACMDACKCN